MKEFWKKYHRIIITTLVVLLVAAGAAAAWFLFYSEDAPIEVTSAWPEADSERVVPKPAEPPTWPLTGLPAPDANTPKNLRVVSVKIENSPEARPQSGIQDADVVYETITEGGITRFNAMFHSQAPSTVGPVRSARLSDTDIVPQYGALFVFSGASGQVNSAVSAAGIENLSEDRGVTKGYDRISSRKAPHNLYLNLDEMREEATRRGHASEQVIKPLAYDRRAVEATPAISVVDIPFSPANRVKWTYDAENDNYLRENNGRVHSDAITGDQITAKNVVVIWAKMTAAGKRDVTGSPTYDIQLVGSDRVTIFRNGQKYDGVWEATADKPPTFKAADGTQIRLAPGNTWVQVVPTNVNIIMQ